MSCGIEETAKKVIDELLDNEGNFYNTESYPTRCEGCKRFYVLIALFALTLFVSGCNKKPPVDVYFGIKYTVDYTMYIENKSKNDTLNIYLYVNGEKVTQHGLINLNPYKLSAGECFNIDCYEPKIEPGNRYEIYAEGYSSPVTGTMPKKKGLPKRNRYGALE